MLCREIIAVCSQIHTKHIYTLCGQNVELLNVKLAVHVVITNRKGIRYQVRNLDNHTTLWLTILQVRHPEH